MMIRLAYGFVAGRDRGVWASGPDGAAAEARRADLAPGSPVVVGPRTAAADEIAAALADLVGLVERGGPVVAGADVDLGNGLRSGRLEGGTGDRRDAVLAALRVLGPDGMHRLGDRSAVLVALFGPAATKRVGAAASQALHDGRWAALHLASAASDLLGPEQLERILTLIDSESPGGDPERGEHEPYGQASQVAADLARVLTPYPRARRLTLLLDLWNVVAAQRRAAGRRRRLRELCGGDDWIDPVRRRYQMLVDDEISDVFGDGRPVRPAELARWVPPAGFWHGWLTRTMFDALAATVLLRTAVAVAEDGLVAGLDRVRHLLALAPELLTRGERTRASRRVPELPVAARPGVYVHELDQLLPGPDVGAALAGRRGREIEAIVHRRLSLARAYGIVVLEAVDVLLDQWVNTPPGLGITWPSGRLAAWREAAGYTAQRPPGQWQQPVLAQQPMDDTPVHRPDPLAQRLAAQPDAVASTVETLGDLLWYAELGDAVAQVDGHDAAEVHVDELRLSVDAHPPRRGPEPLRPGDDSIPRAASGAALLLDLGAQVPAKPRSWPELIDGLLQSTVVAEALTGTFAVPRVLLDRNGMALPDGPESGGLEVVVDIARDPHQLVAWAEYMGNCISGPHYVSEAFHGRCVLAALRTADGALLANVELRPHRTGWYIGEFRTRFNNWPSDALDARLRNWVGTLPPPPAVRAAPAPRRGHVADRRPYRPGSELARIRTALVPLTSGALASPEALIAIDVMSLDGSGAVGLTALRRLGLVALDEAVRSALAGGLHLLGLWRATGVRPLAQALSNLEPALPDRAGSLPALLADAPLPALPRRLARTPPIGEARTVEIVARRIRRSLGRLARADDPVLARLVPQQADVGLLCALVLAVSTSAGTAATSVITRDRAVPGHPSSTLDDPDGPWYRVHDDALELGADASRLPAPALLTPTSWLPRTGWPTLWSRAHRRRLLLPQSR